MKELKLDKATEQRLVEAIQRHMAEHFGEELGTLKAGLLLRFCLEEIGPAIYSAAIADATRYFTEKVMDLENTCFLEEKKRPGGRPGRR